MSNQCLNHAWNIECLNSSERLVLVALADYANKEGKCWPALKTLAQRCCLSVRQIQRILNKLTAKNFLKKIHRYGANNKQVSNIFQLLSDIFYSQNNSQSVPPHDTHVTPPMTPMSPPTYNNMNPNKNPQLTSQGGQIKDKKNATVKSEDERAVTDYEVQLKRGSLSTQEANALPPWEQALLIMAYLNWKTKFKYKPTQANLRLVAAIFEEGYTLDDIRNVIALKWKELGFLAKTVGLMRPNYLFKLSNFVDFASQVRK